MGHELRRPLGIAIVGGLIVSQLLTLYTTPVVYLAFDRLRLRMQRRIRRDASVDPVACRRQAGPADEALRLRWCASRCSACNVGPKYEPARGGRPCRVQGGTAAAYRGAPPAPGSRRSPQDAAHKGKWWEVFGEPELECARGAARHRQPEHRRQYFQNFMAARAQVARRAPATTPLCRVNPGTPTPAAGRTAATAAVGGGAARLHRQRARDRP